MSTKLPDFNNIFFVLLFVSDDSLKIKDLYKIFPDFKPEFIEEQFNKFVKEFNSTSKTLQILKFGDSYKLMTRPEYNYWIELYKTKKKKLTLSKQALETLAIIAYKQPVMLSEIDHIRGVDSSYIVKSLIEKGLVKIIGRKHLPGRPLIFATTEKFLEYFGIEDLSALPSLEEFGDENEKSKK